jgi:hypothetical protein
VGVALVVGAVLVLRPGSSEVVAPQPDHVGPFPRFAVDSVVLPRPSAAVAPPGPVRIVAGPGRLRLAWADGLPGGRPVDGVTGYEVRWRDRVRLVAEPAIQLDGLPQGDYEIEVRSIDPFGQRSVPVRTTGAPLNSAAALPGYTDDFDDAGSVHAEVPGSRWHVSGYRGCVDLTSGNEAKKGQLAIQLACGADDVVLRSRAALQLTGGSGRVTAITDTAGPGGTLTFDFVPGPADRVGARGAGESPLPAGTIRVSISDDGVRVTTGAGVPRGGSVPAAAPPARRGSGVLHQFDVALTSDGLRVFQDSDLVGGTDVLAPWTTASVLVGMAGPPGRQCRIYVDAIALSQVVPPAEQVTEFEASLGTQRVLRPQENAPGIGVSRKPLVGAAHARMRVTVTLGAGVDPGALALQIGDRTLPLQPATPGPPAAAGTDVSLVADLPPDLLVGDEPSSLSPLVIRGPGSAAVLQSYLEIVPGPSSSLGPPRPDPQLKPRVPALPTASVKLGDLNGRDLGRTAPSSAPFVMEVKLDGGLVQRDADELEPVRGFEVFVNDRLIASVPTDLGGPAIGGTYRLTVSLPGQLPGDQTMDIRVHSASGRTQSTLVPLAIS